MKADLLNPSPLAIAKVFLVSTLSFISALAWRDAFRSLFMQILQTDESLKAMFIYAAVVTIVTIVVSYVVYLLSKKKSK